MPRPSRESVQRVAAMMKDADKNFQCDGFASEFQQTLTERNIAHQGQVLVLRRTSPNLDDKTARLVDLAMGSDGTTYPPSVDGTVNKLDPNYVSAKRRVLPKIILDEPSHELHNMVVGNESHFWTEVECDDGKTYCFDNNHPSGVDKESFLASLDFCLERYRPEDGTRDESKVQVFNDQSHQFMSREEIMENGQVVIAPLSVDQQRSLAQNITDWKTFPNKLTGAASVSEADLRPPQAAQQQDASATMQSMRDQMKALRSQHSDAQAEVDLSDDSKLSMS